MDHEEIEAIVGEFVFAHKEVQAKRGKIIGDRINLRIFFLVNDLEIGMTGRAGLGTDDVCPAFDAVIGDAFGGIAIAALGADHMPF